MGLLFLKIILLIFWLFISYTIIKAYSSFAPWVPIFKQDVERVIELANLKPDENFLDLGCGNGRLCLALARKTEANIAGIELAWPLYAICKIRQFIYNKKSLKFVFGDLFKADLKDIDVIYTYGLPTQIKNRLSQKILSEAKPGARIISYCFEIPGLELIRTSQPSEQDLPIYYYFIKN